MGQRTRARIGTDEGVRTVRVYSANPKTADGYNTFIFRREIARSLGKLAWATVIDGSRNPIPEGVEVGGKSVRYSVDDKRRLVEFVERIANTQKGPVENGDFGHFEITKVFATEVQCHAISTRREIEAVSSAAEIARSMIHFVASPNEEVKRKKPNKYFEYGLAKIRLSDGVYLVMGEVGIRVKKRPYYDQRVVAKFKVDSEVTSLHGQTQIGESTFERVYDNRFRLILQGVEMYYKQSPQFSVIIPVYKTPPQLLRDCLDSVLAYSGQMELVCVLDSPGEPCEAVLDEYASREPRVRLLKNDRNRGVSYSRNRGLDAATGEYVTFVDADDRIIAPVYEQGLERAGQKGAACCRLRVREDRDPGFDLDACVTGTVFDADAAGLPIGLLGMSACATLFRTEALRTLGIRFPEDYRVCEDMIFMERFMAAGRRIAFLNTCGYEIVGHPDSVTRRAVMDAAVFVQPLRANLAILRDVLEKGVSDVVVKWYLGALVMFLLRGRSAVRAHVTGADRIEYIRLLRETAELIAEKCARLVSLPTHALFVLLRRAPGLWFLPKMPLMFALRILNHYGFILKKS